MRAYSDYTFREGKAATSGDPITMDKPKIKNSNYIQTAKVNPGASVWSVFLLKKGNIGYISV